MPRTFADRVSIIIAVVLLSLFGFSILGAKSGGIFRLEWSTQLGFLPVPTSARLNLEPGIDIAGGYRLVYEIKSASSAAQDNLAEQVMTVLKKRVDPTGTRNLVWRAQGERQIEIRIPRSAMSSSESATIKIEYERIERQLAAWNVEPPHVEYVMKSLTGEAREKALNFLARNRELGTGENAPVCNPRIEIFKELLAKDKERAGLQTQDLSPAMRGEMRYQIGQRIESLLKDVGLKTNVMVSDIIKCIEIPNDQNRAKLAAYKRNLPERAELIKKLEEIYPRFAEVRNTIDDIRDFNTLVHGSGVLNFHILVRETPETAAQINAMVKGLAEKGPEFELIDKENPARGAIMKWFQVAKPDDFSHPKWPNRNQEPNEKEPTTKYYSICWNTNEKSLVHKEVGGGDWTLKRAFRTSDQNGKRAVGFEFDTDGGKRFMSLTGQNLQQPLATVLDGKIITAPTIQSQIGTNGIITGEYTDFEQGYLANTLNAGALPAQLEDEPIESRRIGPELGESNLKAGLFACVAGLFIAAVFLIIYYHLAGLVGVVALIVNFILILGISGMMGATFTLPGIAALVLTTGMAVDANVLIFERLREEQLRGLSLQLALKNAYDRAFTAILDSNVTTAITSIFLIAFGSEDVKGFGLTLLIGILTSLFAALYVTRTVFAVMLNRFKLKKLGSLPLTFRKWNDLLHPKIDWMGKIPYFLTFSAIIIGLGLTAFIMQSLNRKMFDVEFQSGTQVQFATRKPMKDIEVRERIEKEKDAVPQPSVVVIGDSGKDFIVVTSNVERKDVQDAITRAMGENLDSVRPSDFSIAEANGEEKTARLVNKPAVIPVQPTDNRFAPVRGARALSIEEWLPYMDGVAIHMKDLNPRLKPIEVQERVQRELGKRRESRGIEFDVVALDTTKRDAESGSILILASNPAILERLRANDEPARQARLIVPLWKAIKDGVVAPPPFNANNIKPQVAQGTQIDATLATIGSMVFIMIWIWLRFGDHKYGTATIFAMIHDTVLVVGAIGLSHWLADSFIGKALAVEAFRVNMTLVAAVLTVMGYSMVDTIVVFDRIREIRGKYGVISRSLINDAINQTLSRTLLTAGTTLVTLLVMYIWGGAAIHGFTFVLFIGIIIGTYSSIAVAAPILLIGAKQPAGQKPKTDPSAQSSAPSVGTV